jgi:hypothetical protein
VTDHTQEYHDAQSRLARAQTKESEAPWGSLERDQARGEKIQAENDLYRIEQERAHPERYEPTVILVAPSDIAFTDSAGIEWVDGRATVPKSVAERYVNDLEGYEIEEAS